MKLFLWEELDHLTGRYHSGGGLVIIADSIERAKEIAKEHSDKYQKETDGAPCFIIDKEPDIILNTDATEEAFYAFPDAGCC